MLDQFRIVQPWPVPGSPVRRFAAVQNRSGRRVLLHVWSEQTGLSWPEARQLAERSRQVRHPSLDRIYQTVSASGHYVISQWPDGNRLQDRLPQNGQLPSEQACTIVRQLAAGIAQMHAHKLIHGHLYPSEVVVRPNGQVTLLRQPFWSPTPQELAAMPVNESSAVARFLAPEFLRPGTCPDALTDIYALGCLLYTLVVGRPPFDGQSVNEIMTAHATSSIESLARIAGAPGGLTEFISRMMAKRRDVRLSGMELVVDGLAHFCDLTPDARPAAVSVVPTSRQRVRHRLAQRVVWIVVGALCAAMLIVAAWPRGKPKTVALSRDSESRRPTSDHSHLTLTDSAADSDIQREPDTPPADFAVVDDDGRTLWMSPTSGAPILAKHVPAGVQMLVHLRPAALLAAESRTHVLKALGPRFEQLSRRFARQTGIELSEVNSLQLAFVPQDQGAPRVTWSAELTQGARESAWQRSALRRPMPAGEAAELEGQPVFFPADEALVLVGGDSTHLAEISAAADPPPLRRQIELLRRATDSERQLTILVTPTFLVADGRSLLDGVLAPLREPLLELLGDGTQAASLSLHLAENSYAELRCLGPSDISPLQGAADRRLRLARFPEQVGEFLGRQELDPYWQPLAVRLPLMLQFAVQQVRSGVDGQVAVLNLMLPGEAAHNLILAGELALGSSPRSSDAIAPAQPSAPPASKLIEQLLAQAVSLTIDVQSLEATLDEFAEVVRKESGGLEFTVRIAGPDLQLEGITRNQQIRDLALRQEPVRQILTELVRRANPILVPDVSHPQQKLVWVVEPGQPAGILITTRAAASQKGLPLPPEFLAKPAP